MEGPGHIQAGEVTKTRRPYAPRMPPLERREQLLDAALHVILEQGYTGVSIEAVARAAGVTRPVIYDHFPNLAQLLHALIEREESFALTQIDSMIPAKPSEAVAGQTLPLAIRRLLEKISLRPQAWRLILLPPAGTPAIVREHVERNRERTLARLEGLVRWTFERAALPSVLDVELTARTIRDLIEEAGRMVLTDPRRYSPERYERHLASLLDLIGSRDATVD
jgi:AcrR family transcriptional regulator